MSDKANHYKDWVTSLGPWDMPVLSHLPYKRYDPFEGLPRKDVAGTHPYKAKLYMAIARSLSWMAYRLQGIESWLDYHADATFFPKGEWRDHTEVDWDQVSPEERKKRTTITFTMGGTLLKDVDAE